MKCIHCGKIWNFTSEEETEILECTRKLKSILHQKGFKTNLSEGNSLDLLDGTSACCESPMILWHFPEKKK